MDNRGKIPIDHVLFLFKLKYEYSIEPKVIYDIGANYLHWTNITKKEVWPDAEYILFDGYRPLSHLYSDYKHFVGVLSDVDGRKVKYYVNHEFPGGCSYYKENTQAYIDSEYVEEDTYKLDSVVEEYSFPLPDLVKLDVQGAEIDILKGALETFKNAKCLIVELQSTEYNIGAMTVEKSLPIIESMGWTCIARKFCDNGPDADYCFIRR